MSDKGTANKPPTRIYLSRGSPTGTWASDWEWSGCWSIHPSENAVEYCLVVTLCGNCGLEYVNVSDAEKHGIGKCNAGQFLVNDSGPFDPAQTD